MSRRAPRLPDQPALDGLRLRDDGVHLSADGADLVWRWLGPRLRRLAGG